MLYVCKAAGVRAYDIWTGQSLLSGAPGELGCGHGQLLSHPGVDESQLLALSRVVLFLAPRLHCIST